MAAIENRYDFTVLFDVMGGNPNGDPDAENAPRVDRLTKRGFVTDVCLKRKIRDYVDVVKGADPGFQIHVRRGSALNDAHNEALQKAGAVADSGDETAPDTKKGKVAKKKNPTEVIDRARELMCAQFYDVRTFGSVLANKAGNDQVRGPVQIGMAFSIDKVLPQRVGITRVAATEAEEGKENKTMGNKWMVPYALFRAQGHVSVPLARKTGFSEDDLNLLWKALINCFEHDRSATRGFMSARKLVAFKHDDPLGNTPAAMLFDRIKVARIDGQEEPLACFDQYRVTVDADMMPKGVHVLELL
jgi:CRISPR-associated protein Csd2